MKKIILLVLIIWSCLPCWSFNSMAICDDRYSDFYNIIISKDAKIPHPYKLLRVWETDYVNGEFTHGKYNFIDSNGNLISDVWFDDATILNNFNLAIVRIGDACNVINENGALQNKEWFTIADEIINSKDLRLDYSTESCGYVWIKEDKALVVFNKDGKFNLLKPNGKLASEKWFSRIRQYYTYNKQGEYFFESNNCYVGKIRGKKIYFDERGEILNNVYVDKEEHKFGKSIGIVLVAIIVGFFVMGIASSLKPNNNQSQENQETPSKSQQRTQDNSQQQDKQFFGYYVYLANIKDTDEYRIGITTNVVVTTNYHKNYIPNFQIIAKKHFQTHSEAQSYEKCAKIHFGDKQEISGGWYNLTKDELEEIERVFFYAEYYWKVEHHNQQAEQENANTSYQYEQPKQDEVKQKPQPKPCYVYLIENPSEHWYKIGISTNIESRFRAIRNALPNAKLITKKKFINTKEAQKIEKMLHTQYAHCNVGLEWFNPTDDELTTIKALLS